MRYLTAPCLALLKNISNCALSANFLRKTLRRDVLDQFDTEFDLALHSDLRFVEATVIIKSICLHDYYYCFLFLSVF